MATSDFPLGLFAFRQVRRLNGLAGVESVFQRDDFGSDMTTEGLGLLKSVVRGEGLYHGVVGGNEDPEGFTWNLRSGVYESDGFHSAGSSPSSMSSALI
jgi:hypothetical protein